MTNSNPAQTSTIALSFTARAYKKSQTRERLIDAARSAFIDRGYEAATIRDIATMADLSTGAVFVTFADKADLFNAVMVREKIILSQLMAKVDTQSLKTREALICLMGVAYDRDLDQLELVKAATAFTLQRDTVSEARDRESLQPVLMTLIEVIRAGIARRDVSPDLDAKLCAEMIWTLYQSTFRHVVFGDWNVAQLIGLLAAQVDVLLRGFGHEVQEEGRPSLGQDFDDVQPLETIRQMAQQAASAS